jgi:hypothetical protein
MPVSATSRYAQQSLLSVVAPDGTSRNVLALRLRRPDADAAKLNHRVTHGEAIDLIAHRHLLKASLWWLVMDCNDAVFPLDLDGGDVLRLPEPGPATRTNRARRF